MKKLLLVGAALALCLGSASAQNITKSLQGSQDPRGPVGIDTSNSSYFPGHINAFGNFTANPSIASGGNGCSSTSTITAGSTDAAGSVAVAGQAAGATSCAITFGSPFNAAPHCIVSETVNTAAGGSPFAVTTTTVSFAVTPVASGATLNWICIGNQ